MSCHNCDLLGLNLAVRHGKPQMGWPSTDPKSDRPESEGQEPCLDNAEKNEAYRPARYCVEARRAGQVQREGAH